MADHDPRSASHRAEEARRKGSPVRHLAELIHGVRVAMMTTARSDGSLHTRPMWSHQTKPSEFDGTLWFFTHASAPKTDEVQHDAHVSLSYASPEKDDYVAVSGRARVVRDRAKIRALWNPTLKAWFPDGVDDPDIALLQVTVTRAEYWDSPSSRLVQAVGFTKALLTGQQYRPGGNTKLDFADAPAAPAPSAERAGDPAKAADPQTSTDAPPSIH